MKFLVKLVIGLFLLATQAQADLKDERIDVVLWLEGCAALTQTGSYGTVMDTNCSGNAMKYCELRPEAEILPCFDTLSTYWDTQTRQILETLPDDPDLTGFRKRSFERRKARVTSPDFRPDCVGSGVKKDEAKNAEICAMVRSAISWSEVRDLVRLVEMNERSKP